MIGVPLKFQRPPNLVAAPWPSLTGYRRLAIRWISTYQTPLLHLAEDILDAFHAALRAEQHNGVWSPRAGTGVVSQRKAFPLSPKTSIARAVKSTSRSTIGTLNNIGVKAQPGEPVEVLRWRNTSAPARYNSRSALSFGSASNTSSNALMGARQH